jgi:hypothetical protein
MRAAPLIALSLLLGGCSRNVVTLADAPALAGDYPTQPAPLSVTLQYDDPLAELGWGTFDLTAHPTEHEFRVDLMVGAAMRDARWRYCGAGRLVIDGDGKWLPFEWRGVPMAGGVYDAVTVDLTIDDVRRMASADQVEVELCGDRVTLTPAHRAELPEFVRRFEEMATYDGPSAPERRPTLDWEPKAPRMNTSPADT